MNKLEELITCKDCKVMGELIGREGKFIVVHFCKTKGQYMNSPIPELTFEKVSASLETHLEV